MSTPFPFVWAVATNKKRRCLTIRSLNPYAL